jgi:hypothetical protein
MNTVDAHGYTIELPMQRATPPGTESTAFLY